MKEADLLRQTTIRLPQRLCAFLLSLALCLSLLPVTALAAGTDTGKAIQLVDSGTAANIDGYDSTDGYDYIYYGTWNDSAIKWRVLDDQTNTGENGLFLLSEELLGTGNYGGVYFQQSYHYDSSSGSYHKGSAPANGDHTDCLIANAWQGSDAQTWCATFYSSNFSTGEQGAVIATTKSDAAFTSSTHSFSFAASENILNGDKVFFLSAQEAENSEYGFTNDAARIANYGGSAGVWWLRSPYAYFAHSAGAVRINGDVSLDDVYDVWAARPAFNLDLTSVLFTSAAVGGKIPAASSGGNQGGEAADAIFEIGDYDGSEWKLTLLDNSRDFSISNEVTNSKGSIGFSYSGAQTGENEYISVVIENSGAITHYGRILQLDGATNGASGIARLTLPENVTLSDTTKLYVFNEQYNGGENDDTKLTDYASRLVEVNPTVDTTAPTLSSDSASRDSDTTATVKFTSSEAGTYYYAVVESNETEPTIDTTVAGTSCISGENTISLTTLTGLGAKELYIVAKDAVGNVSKSLKIGIPEYIPPVYGISADTAVLDFGAVTEGYTEAPAAKTVTITNTGNQTVTVTLPSSEKYTITAGEGFTNGSATLAANDGTATFTVQPNTGLAVGSYPETLTISGSNSTSASVELSFEVLETYTLTVDLNGGSGSTIGGTYPAGAVVQIDAGSRSNYRFTGWTSSNGGSFADASKASTTFTMPAADTTITANWRYIGGGTTPSNPTKTPSQQAVDKIEDAKDGDTVKITLPAGQTTLDKEVFETLAGRDVTLEVSVPGGVTWTVNGQDIPETAALSDIDMGVSMNTSTIPVNLINAITGEVGTVQITLAHDGPFGFTMTLTAPVGAENAGYWANLYHYNEDTETLSYETSGEIAEDGTASLRMSHASQYAIIIDEQSHQLPFTDLTAGAWYDSAVRYAYLNGIMVGTSNTTFAPEGTLTRAQVAQILYNLEGQPAVTGESTFPDAADAGQWALDAIAWAQQTGVVAGYEDKTFRPEKAVTREELAQMLYNYAQCKGYDLTTTGDLTAFPDGNQVSTWAETAMSWANGNDLINGFEDNTLRPGGNSTRAQAASILMKFDLNVAEN